MNDPWSRLPEKEGTLIRLLAERTRSQGGRLLCVGGAVRDILRGESAYEIDAEIFGIPFEELPGKIGDGIELIQVGRSFPVFKVKGYQIDIATPRREWKTGQKHTDFGFEADPCLDFADAAKRRDFTINAIGFDPLDHSLEDPFNGETDLENKILRPVSSQFSEDPLRVLRTMQFLARFEMQAAPETIKVCRSLSQASLAKERIFEEWKKLLLLGKLPSRGLFFLGEVGWLRFYPELERTVDCPQDPRWHPEGSVWNHTAYCMDAFAKERIDNETEDLVVGLAVLCHDLGKPLATVIEPDGSIRSPGHERTGIEPTKTLLSRFTRETFWFEAIAPLVETHMRPRQLFESRSSAAAVRRLAERAGRLDRLIRVCKADSGGRPPLPPGKFEEGTWLLEQARRLSLEKEKPKPLLLGRDLIEIGIEPGPQMGALLKVLFEEQLDGVFEDRETGLDRAREKISR